MSKELKFVRLITGEELLGYVTNDWSPGEGSIVLVEVVQMIANEQGVGFAKYLQYTDAHDRVDINPVHVTFVANPQPELAAAYSRFLGKVFAPEKKLIVPGT